MRAVIIDRPNEIRVGNVADPTPKADELVIRVGACGICGTDLHIAHGEFPRHLILSYRAMNLLVRSWLSGAISRN